MFQILWLGGVVAFIFIAFRMATDDQFIINWIKQSNEMRGIKTKITPKTIQTMRISAVLGIVMAIVMIIMSAPYIFR